MKFPRALFTMACLLLTHEALACSACFGAPGAAQTQGMNNAILMLLGVTVTIAGGAGAVAMRIAKAESNVPALPAPADAAHPPRDEGANP
jgi:hypothetical protein